MNALNPVRRIERADRRADRGPAGRRRDRRRWPGPAELLELVGIPQKRGPGLPARAVGRDAPAGDDRDGPRLRPGDRHRRRADDRARRDGPGPDPGAARAAPARARAVPHPHHPRPVGHRRDLRPGPDHVRRPGGRGGHRSSGSSASRAIRTPRSSSGRSRTSAPTAGASRRSRARRPTCAPRRRAAGSILAAPSRWTSAARSSPPEVTFADGVRVACHLYPAGQRRGRRSR